MSYYDFDVTNVKEAAKKCAGNWRYFDSFMYSPEYDDPQDCYVFYPSHRDSDLLDEANYKVMLNILADKFPDSADYWLECHSHWAVGYVNAIVVRVYRSGEITDVFSELLDMFYQLQQYPVLSDDILSELESDAFFENTADCIHWVLSKYDIDCEESDDLTSDVTLWLSENYPSEEENIDGRGAYPSEDIVRLFFGVEDNG